MERRRHPRIMRPFEGTWSGASGAAPCRIGDISLGGCFVESRATPAPGEATVVSVVVTGHTFSFAGTVVQTHPGMGFSVKFDDVSPEAANQLERLFEALEAGG